MQRIINPATGQLITQLPRANKDDIKKTIACSRLAFDNGPWPRLSLSERKDYILKIAQGIMDNAQELAQLETRNTGKPIKETTFMDVPSSAKTFEFFANNLQTYLKDKRVRLDSGAEGSLYYEPLGIVALIVPWNYPLLIASWKMAQALAAGNCIILKPSSLTPLTALKLMDIIKASGIPQDVVNLVIASGQGVGQVLCADPNIDMISFTGSTHTGRDIMRSASSSTKKLIMELGGKSASIILSDCNLEAAVMGSLTSIFLNQGQMCTAMSRILVDKKISAQFIEMFVDKARKIRLGDGLDIQTQMGPLISGEHRQKIISYVSQGQRQGAKILCGGRIPDDPKLKNGFFFEPTVFGGVSPEMSIFQEEIFGPVACISEFSDQAEAVRLANHSNFGLACSIWGSDLARAQGLGSKIDAGTIWINTYGMFHNELPYGGFKQSGFGKELGREGLLEYTRLKNINYDLSQDRPLVSYWYAFG